MTHSRNAPLHPLVAKARAQARLWRLVDMPRSNRRCWRLRGSVDRIRLVGQSWTATLPRATLELLGVTVPKGARVEHTCGDVRCLQPTHLRFGLRPRDVRTIRRLRDRGIITRELAARYRCSQAAISYAARRKRWRKVR